MIRYIWLLIYIDKIINQQVDFDQQAYDVLESQGKVCIKLNFSNQSSTDHDISVKLLAVNSDTNNIVKGMYVIPTI